jgi:M6 family metalloprotease-like protein
MKKTIMLLILSGFMIILIAAGVINLTGEIFDVIHGSYRELLNKNEYALLTEDKTLDLPLTMEINGKQSSLEYTSSDAETLTIVGNQGVITQGVGMKSVKLGAKITYSSISLTYYLNVSTIGKKYEDHSFDPYWTTIESALNASAPNKNAISANLNLLQSLPSAPTLGIIWSSSIPRVINAQGQVHPTLGSNNVDLTCVLTLDSKLSIRTYSLTTAKLNYSIQDYEPYSGYEYNLNERIKEFGIDGLRSGIPSVNSDRGAVSLNVLVVPVQFSDQKFSAEQLDILRRGFFGTSEETGWESVSSFYNKSSFGKVSFNGTVLSPYTYVGDISLSNDHGSIDWNGDGLISSNEFAAFYEVRADYQVIAESKDFINQNTTPSQHDVDGDGFIDGIYFVYARDYDRAGSDIWWAYKSLYYAGYNNSPDIVYDGDIRPSVFMWASQYFMEFERGAALEINAETFIHETGHMFGLPDFYDTDSKVGVSGGMGGFDMMDNNLGDHGPFTKLMFGWINPQVITQTTTVKLYPATTSGQVLLIPYEWHNSLFSEYLLVDFYTPDGLYAYLQNTSASGGRPYFSIPGVRVYHVDATLGYPFMYNNSTTDHKLVDYISAQNKNQNTSSYKIKNDDMFQIEGNKFDWEGLQWYSYGLTYPFVEVVVQEYAADFSYVIISITYEV